MRRTASFCDARDASRRRQNVKTSPRITDTAAAAAAGAARWSPVAAARDYFGHLS